MDFNTNHGEVENLARRPSASTFNPFESTFVDHFPSFSGLSQAGPAASATTSNGEHEENRLELSIDTIACVCPAEIDVSAANETDDDSPVLLTPRSAGTPPTLLGQDLLSTPPRPSGAGGGFPMEPGVSPIQPATERRLAAQLQTPAPWWTANEGVSINGVLSLAGHETGAASPSREQTPVASQPVPHDNSGDLSPGPLQSLQTGAGLFAAPVTPSRPTSSAFLDDATRAVLRSPFVETQRGTSPMRTPNVRATPRSAENKPRQLRSSRSLRFDPATGSSSGTGTKSKRLRRSRIRGTPSPVASHKNSGLEEATADAAIQTERSYLQRHRITEVSRHTPRHTTKASPLPGQLPPAATAAAPQLSALLADPEHQRQLFPLFMQFCQLCTDYSGKDTTGGLRNSTSAPPPEPERVAPLSSSIYAEIESPLRSAFSAVPAVPRPPSPCYSPSVSSCSCSRGFSARLLDLEKRALHQISPATPMWPSHLSAMLSPREPPLFGTASRVDFGGNSLLPTTAAYAAAPRTPGYTAPFHPASPANAPPFLATSTSPPQLPRGRANSFGGLATPRAAEWSTQAMFGRPYAPVLTPHHNTQPLQYSGRGATTRAASRGQPSNFWGTTWTRLLPTDDSLSSASSLSDEDDWGLSGEDLSFASLTP